MSICDPDCREALKRQLIKHEGLKLALYQCSAGKTTIGIGRNLDDRGISKDEALYLLENDITAVETQLLAKLPYIVELDEQRQMVLINMAFNLGVHGLLKFKKMLAAVETGDYQQAASQMLDSLWARQVGQRAVELSQMMLQE